METDYSEEEIAALIVNGITETNKAVRAHNFGLYVQDDLRNLYEKHALKDMELEQLNVSWSGFTAGDEGNLTECVQLLRSRKQTSEITIGAIS